MNDDKQKKIIEKFLLEISEILYAQDQYSKKDKVDKILEVLEEEYDF